MNESVENLSVSNLKAPPIYRVIVSQFAAAFSVALIVFVVLGWVMAYSAFIGGAVCAIPNAYFAKKTFMYTGARSSTRIARSIYVGEAIKLLLIAAGFALAFVFVHPINIMLLFAGFITVHIVGIVAAFYMHTSYKP